eukprot:6185126-Pleurochrysis_carterae.AAC.2
MPLRQHAFYLALVLTQRLEADSFYIHLALSQQLTPSAHLSGVPRARSAWMTYRRAACARGVSCKQKSRAVQWAVRGRVQWAVRGR